LVKTTIKPFFLSLLEKVVKHLYIGTRLKKLEKKVKNKVQDATKDVLQLPILFSRRFIFL
jgi:hypothetical protein